MSKLLRTAAVLTAMATPAVADPWKDFIVASGGVVNLYTSAAYFKRVIIRCGDEGVITSQQQLTAQQVNDQILERLEPSVEGDEEIVEQQRVRADAEGVEQLPCAQVIQWLATDAMQALT